MGIVSEIMGQLRSFFGWGGLQSIIGSGDYARLLTWDGIVAMVGPLIPLTLVLEFVRGVLYRRFEVVSYKIPFLTYVFNAVAGRFLSIGMVGLCIGLFEAHRLFRLPFNAWGFVAGYVVWEFGHYLYHWLGHKVRLFWCLHSTHHAPESMHLMVSHAHFLLEAPYADLIRTTVCILLGVPPPMLAVIMIIDGTWGSFIHIGDTMLRKADLGRLGRYILTPSHHRVHHARNPRYIDTNYCNLLNIWDRAFGTYQPERADEQPDYGITRRMRKDSFLDAYFGEFVELARDVIAAPGLWNKLCYIFMPPGWSHTGEHRTAAVLKRGLTPQSSE
jgi:sterol desaturase/sphingolipid hydroxylase (fatty acid hydroxylase superfamily)